MENNFDLKKFLVENRAPQKEVVYEGPVGKFINKQIAKLGRSLGFKERKFEFLSLDQLKQNIERLPESSMFTDNESGKQLAQNIISEFTDLVDLVDMLGKGVKRKEHEGVTYYDANDVYRFFRELLPGLISREEIRDGFAFYDKNQNSEYNEDMFDDMVALSLTGYFSDIITSLPDGYKTDLGDFRIGEGSEEEHDDRDEELIDKLTPVSQKLEEEEMLNESSGMLMALAGILSSLVAIGKVEQQIKKAKKGEYGPKKQEIGNRLSKFINHLADRLGGE